MKKNIAPILTGLIIAVGTGILVAHAVETYTPLAPLPGTLTAGKETTNMSDYLAGMIKLLIALGAGTAILFAIIGGTQYVAASINPSAKKDALDRIWNALIGLTIMLTSYLLLNSINPELVNVGFNLPSVIPKVTQQTYVTVSPYAPGKTSCFSNADCNTSAGYTCDYLINESGETGTQNCILSAASSQCNPLVSPSGCISGSTWPDDNTFRSMLTPLVKVYNGNCSSVGESGCTSLFGLGSNVINNLNTLQVACNCYISITGGTEYWLHGDKNKDLEVAKSHTKHYPGGNVVDLSKSTPVTDYIIANGGTPTYESGCAYGKHYKIGSATYVDETTSTASTGVHWHVCY